MQGKIKVRLDSGANIHSANEHKLSLEDLGYETPEEWKKLSEEEKFEAVKEFFWGLGYPEYSWNDEGLG